MIYKKINWKYRTFSREVFKTLLRPPVTLITEWITLETDGTLTLEPGYAWDGASGPAIDTKDFMRGSAAHDALYQLMRIGLLKPDEQVGSLTNFNLANLTLADICREDGMPELRIAYVYEAVQKFGTGFMKSHPEEIYEAP